MYSLLRFLYENKINTFSAERATEVLLVEPFLKAIFVENVKLAAVELLYRFVCIFEFIPAYTALWVFEYSDGLCVSDCLNSNSSHLSGICVLPGLFIKFEFFLADVVLRSIPFTCKYSSMRWSITYGLILQRFGCFFVFSKLISFIKFFKVNS